jgi:hypothetical protein
VREGRAAQVTMTAIKLGMVLLIGVAAFLLPHAPAAHPMSLAPAVGLAGVIAAYQLISGAYSGWPNPVYFAEEDVAPARLTSRARSMAPFSRLRRSIC